MGEQPESSTIPAFCYAAEDVPILRNVGSTLPAPRMSAAGGVHDQAAPQLDEFICSRWDVAMSSGTVFRYNLADVSTRRLPGQFGFVVQRNPKRFSHRRIPHEMSSLTQPFNPELFNFNKVRREEILFEVRRTERSGKDDTEDSCSLAIVNVSPIDYGHILLVPQPQKCLPQVLMEDSLRMCLEIVALSRHSCTAGGVVTSCSLGLIPLSGFCMVANSLLAHASINHLHYHFLYLERPLMADAAGGRPLVQGCYELTNHCSRGFGFQMDTTAEGCARRIYRVVSLLLELGLPHNVAMHWGQMFDQQHSNGSTRGEGTGGKMVVRTLLVPRKPSLGMKKLFEGGGTPPFFPAACELVLGFIPVLDQSKYGSLTEEEVLQVLDEMTLPQEDFDSLKEKITTSLSL